MGDALLLLFCKEIGTIEQKNETPSSEQNVKSLVPVVIVIFSTREMEETTIKVMEWIARLDRPCIRINAEDIPEMEFALEPSQNGGKSLLQVAGRTIAPHEVRSVWFRRTRSYAPPNLDEVTDPGLRATMERHMSSEMRAAVATLYHVFKHARWLSSPSTSVPHKFHVLQKAREVGLKVPETLVTSSKNELTAFAERVGEIIVKCIADPDIFEKDDLQFGIFTSLLERDHIDRLPDRFFPILVQKRVRKAWEIRTFFLDGSCYSMAIFSQNNPRTRVDFRKYDFKKPNRFVPYRLAEEASEKIDSLMRALCLDTGSLDLIRSSDGDLYFLEVNPVGQFGMVSHPCNMYLEKLVAARLVEKDAAN